MHNVKSADHRINLISDAVIDVFNAHCAGTWAASCALLDFHDFTHYAPGMIREYSRYAKRDIPPGVPYVTVSGLEWVPNILHVHHHTLVPAEYIDALPEPTGGRLRGQRVWPHGRYSVEHRTALTPGHVDTDWVLSYPLKTYSAGGFKVKYVLPPHSRRFNVRFSEAEAHAALAAIRVATYGAR